MFFQAEKWVRNLPHSRIAYPERIFDQLKYWFWTIYTRFYPVIRRIAYHLGIGKLFINTFEYGHSGRQPFLIGTIDPSRSAHDLALFLVEQGYGNHFVAWKDAGEILSLRKTVDFEYQYHLRVFKDGEVRCHYEYTPESHPYLHMIQRGFESREEEFRALLAGWIVPIPTKE